MCIAVPMKIVELNYPMAICEAKGVRREVNLMLLDESNVKVGDYVVVHVGTAIEVIREEEAKKIWELYEEIEALLEEG
ncbi:hydrogenase assembly chaperone hypC/hupF [Thermosulfidibacter takaii ABI70S6]|uniref:Hydrogenase assembly chaperone hypC/hupF n=1 Tax=Thermosulfidibacter takaii (strain DSM 17441 / JCM 13301 / NBRC 103674 / ABI70S6) TaxID=1298851 RepID=A0A0S3QUC8_THET7|nr:HypC/HybG/HupF family hydrogenase formation chaperone [Thermosulfidibacter takaii]BAT71945.1 hydrogenase assembly chaperone hypC/hupF [Thermosulfidibacter takaii ABI70S6]